MLVYRDVHVTSRVVKIVPIGNFPLEKKNNKLERLVKKFNQKRQRSKNVARPSQTHQSLQRENTVVNLS